MREPDKKNGLNFSKKSFYILLLSALVFSLGIIIGQEQIIHFNLPAKQQPAQNETLPDKLDYRGVNELYDLLKDGFDGELDPNTLTDGLKQGLVKAAGDPYTEYLNAEESKDFDEGLNGSFEGIGAELGKEGDSIVIVSPISGFPADKAGLKAKDKIVEINQESAADITITEAVKKIRGKKGTKVKLSVLRDEKKLDFEITRDKITIPSVKSKIIEDNIGLIEISRFGTDTFDLTEKAAKDFKAKGIKKIILDLRGNPGGLLDASVDVSELWVPKGAKILEEKRGGVVLKAYNSTKVPILSGVKTVILINEGSASASEIVSGALKDNNLATIIGVKSYGKGSVQEVKPLDFGGSLKVTVARWFTPGGRNIDKEGIKPDKKVEITEQDIKAVKDPQKAAAIKFLEK